LTDGQFVGGQFVNGQLVGGKFVGNQFVGGHLKIENVVGPIGIETIRVIDEGTADSPSHSELLKPCK